MLSSLTGLEAVELFRPREFAGHVELQVGVPAIRRWPTRVCMGFEISLQIGPAHEEIVQGRRTETPGKVTFVQLPGTVWSAQRAVGAFLSLEVSPELFERLLAEWPSRPSLPGPAQVALPRLVDAFWSRHKLLRAPGDATARSEALVSLVGMAIESLTGKAPPAAIGCDLVARARDALHDCSAQAPTMDALAAYSGLPTLQLVRAFRRRFGVGPARYRRALRAARARRLLLAGRAVAEIVTEMAFASEAELRRTFSAHFGLEPDHYQTLSCGA